MSQEIYSIGKQNRQFLKQAFLAIQLSEPQYMLIFNSRQKNAIPGKEPDWLPLKVAYKTHLGEHRVMVDIPVL